MLPTDYILDHLPASEDMFYVASPKDVVVAKERDLDDHIKWLLERSRYEEALKSLREAEAMGEHSHAYDVVGVGQQYISYLMKQGIVL
jgi:hypothetical protein